ncbi:hypothetical protein [Adhaeribacter rhizoryzae]|uniref:Uncharacterized protein n=1 Tax=Adhaeribacter rhizoryzae TaxID=2607907 RepID=A0A5M6DJV0_9BACT|nr:hypothetical protein [Adhaeribacter rhizoryzae]KAA5546499.1 hypothetical protein F0145_11455 [Adhaeribacter rhizoryzae]
MKNIANILFIAAVLIFTNCQPEKKSTVITTPAPNNNVTTNQPTVNGGDPVQATNSQNQAATPVNPVGLNPAHGLPGHRCDIPVGARLDSPPQSNPTIAPQLPAPTLPLPSAPGLVAAGTNPPHGQPGHDCAIPVGAPLKK